MQGPMDFRIGPYSLIWIPTGYSNRYKHLLKKQNWNPDFNLLLPKLLWTDRLTRYCDDLKNLTVFDITIIWSILYGSYNTMINSIIFETLNKNVGRTFWCIFALWAFWQSQLVEVRDYRIGHNYTCYHGNQVELKRCKKHTRR